MKLKPCRKKSFKGWLYCWKAFEFVPDENGAVSFTTGVFLLKKDLKERMGNEWGRLAKKVKITIEEL